MTQKYANESGMSELAQIVAGLYKDVKLIKSASNLAGAQRYASKRNGWVASKEDITGPNKVPDGVDEILIRDKHGNIRVVNGWTTKPSKFAERQAYWDNVPLWTQAELDADPSLSPMQRKLKLNQPKKSMSQFKKDLYDYKPQVIDGNYTGNWVPSITDINGGAADVIREKYKISPKKMFTQLIKEVWDNLKNTIPADADKLAIFRIWCNAEYLTRVVKPALSNMDVNYDALPYIEDVAKITNQQRYKKAALNIIYHFGDNLYEFYDYIGADLQEIINRGRDEETLTHLFGDITPKPHKPRA